MCIRFCGEFSSEFIVVASGKRSFGLQAVTNFRHDRFHVAPLGVASYQQTPAALLAGTAPLRVAFEVQVEGRRDGLEWVAVRPRAADAEFRRARFGFAGLELRRLELDDKLGQRAELVFTRSERNGEVRPDELAFTPPAGADLIGKPVQ